MIERLLHMILIPQDKANHAIDGAVYALISGGLAAWLGNDLALACAVAIGVSTALGLAKERYDSHHRDLHSVDGLDILATALGGVVVAAAMWLGAVAKG